MISRVKPFHPNILKTRYLYTPSPKNRMTKPDEMNVIRTLKPNG